MAAPIAAPKVDTTLASPSSWSVKDSSSMLNPANKRINHDVLGHLFGYLANSDEPRHLLARNIAPVAPYLAESPVFKKEWALFIRRPFSGHLVAMKAL